MKKLILALSALSVAAVLSACGGGGGGDSDPVLTTAEASTTEPSTTTTPTTATAAKYAGTWGGCFPTGAATSRQETLVIVQQGDNAASFLFTEVSYGALACAGTAGATTTDNGTIVFSGTTTIGTETVDKGIVTQADGVQKQVFLATATGLSFGKQPGDGGSLDADGYPTTLEDNALARQ